MYSSCLFGCYVRHGLQTQEIECIKRDNDESKSDETPT